MVWHADKVKIHVDDKENRRKRLFYLARHRGTQEADLVLGGFAESYLSGFDDDELDYFEALIGENDADLTDWLSGREEVPAHLAGTVFNLLLEYKNNLLRH